MKGLIDLINAYGGTAIIAIIVGLCFAVREGVEFYEWCKAKFEKKRQKLNGQEKKEETVEERLIRLETRDKVTDEKMEKIQSTIDCLGQQVLEIILDRYRETILDFADVATDENRYPSKEKYNNVFAIYKKYEEELEKHGLSNGQAEISMELIRESYKHRTENHTFLEDIRK